ncbi:MAG: class I SAM-dependent methyltransferase [Thermomicrobiales bacterium]|nr:class I SAM-dependent methyltransferase [Thermomicrobiales bacterium]
MSARFYKTAYRFGFTPWERLETLPAAQQALAMLDRVERERQPPHGAALDIGSGTGVWSVQLAQRGWQVTGIELVARGVKAAQRRAAEVGVEARFIQGDITKSSTEDLGLGRGYRLILDFGTIHGLDADARVAAAQLIDAVAAPNATILMYALSPRSRGMLPDGMDRREIETLYPAWTVVEELAFDTAGLPDSARRDDPHWFRLDRRG